MKICFMCDLHLPVCRDALQYDVLEWAMADICKKEPDCIIFAGDMTCDGDEEVYDYCINKIKETNIPFLYIPGNSDMRNPDTRDSICIKASPCINIIDGQTIAALNDCGGSISDEQMDILDSLDECIVFMHHPVDGNRLQSWCDTHSSARVFYGHKHLSYRKNNVISLQAMDPDKAIGENPCITYYDTDTDEVRKAYYFCPVPTDVYEYFGISCYKAEEQIRFAIERGLKNLELRPNCINTDEAVLTELISDWRKSGGENLSVHLPDVGYADGKAFVEEGYDRLVELVKILKSDRITQHVPVVTVSEVNKDEGVLDSICDFLAQRFNDIPRDIVIGVENMHMTSMDTPDENRRFGYLPEECLEFMNRLSHRCRHKVGINFDIGHARNNIPYSQNYQISTWLSIVGKHIVGYHMHQVTYEDGVFENHMPLTEPYGKLISYASFFRYWAEGRVNKAPVVFEMRPEGAYSTTLDMFDKYRKHRVFDIHSHTFYSNCGRDNPRDLIETAVRNGLSVLGISDHNYGIGERKEEYLRCMRALAREYRGRITLLCGIEIATMPHLYDIRNADEISSYDYCLIEHITDSDSIVKDDLFGFCKALGIPCGIAHTDLFAYCDSKGYDYMEFFTAMAENNIFWEMNVSYDSIHRYREHRYVYDFMYDKAKLDIVKRSGVFISVGFDSHRMEDYDGYKVHSMYEFLIKNGIKTADELLIK